MRAELKRVAKAAVTAAAYAGVGVAGLRRHYQGGHEAPDLGSVRSILAIRVNLVGDLLFTLPAVRALKAASPRARVTMLVLPYTADLLRGLDFVDRVIAMDFNAWRSTSAWVRGRAAREAGLAVGELRSEQYDLCVSFYGRLGSGLAVGSGAAFTVGYGAEGYPFAFDLGLPGRRYESGRHEAEYCLDLARAIGARGEATPVRLSVDPETARGVDALLDEAGVGDNQPIVALHPGALNMAAKRWLPERWAEVADRIQRETQHRVVLVGSRSEVPLAESVRREMATVPVLLSGRTSLPELAALLRRSALFLGGDSGPLHLASAMGVASVSIYGPTDPANTGPLGQNATVLRGDASCAPCYDLKRAATCWRGDLRCMASVSSDEVFDAAMRVLDEGISSAEVGLAPKEPRPPTVRSQDRVPGLDTSLRRILLVKLAGIGDLLTAFPAMESIRRRYPLAEISALVTPQSASLLTGSGLVDDVIVLDKYLFDTPGGFAQLGTLAGLIRLSHCLRARSYDAVVLLHHLLTWQGVLKYAALTLASGAPIRAGLDDGRGRFLNLSMPDSGFGFRHEVEYWLEVASLLGAPAADGVVRVSWTRAEDAYAAGRWREIGLGPGERVVALHPGTGSYSPVRRWPEESFAAVANALAPEGLTPMVVAGPGEEELAHRTASAIAGRSVILRGTPTPRHLAAVLSHCRLFIGNDSGVTHVAAASGVPTVAVFGPSNARAWAPYDPAGARTRVVRTGLACSPCLYRGQSLGLRNGCGDPRCLTGIGPERVVAAAAELLRVQA